MRKPTLTEIENELNLGVQLGHFEKNSDGAFRLTEKGRNLFVLNTLLDFFNFRHDAAYSFGAIVTATKLSSEDIVTGLSKLINDGVIFYGIAGRKNGTYIFHLCNHQKQLHLFLGETERPNDSGFNKHIQQILKNIGSKGGVL